ncbi:hypothetical protein ABT340_04755 [Streptosporangium sp. NPDC000239]|uniref:hypothetical protein n=1 Tax=Streptosporangium sp. NPDC000239 TaxID=3154248 RepID=UPI00331F8194
MSGWEIFLGIALGLIVNEACELSPWAARKLVQWSARARYPDPERAETRAAELVSLIEERPGKLLKLCSAMGFFGAAACMALQRSLLNQLQTASKKIQESFMYDSLKSAFGVYVEIAIRIIVRDKERRKRIRRYYWDTYAPKDPRNRKASIAMLNRLGRIGLVDTKPVDNA